jgi:YD repeat-containing protein
MWRSVLLALMALALCGFAYGQEDPNIEVGLKPFGTYQGGNIDRINVPNGALSIDIPIMSYPQRGGRLKLDLALHYENRGNYTDTVCDYVNDGGCYEAGPSEFIHGFTIVQQGVPVLLGEASDQDANGFLTESALVMTPDGGSHSLAPTNATVWRSLDGSGYQAVFDYSTPGQMWIDAAQLSSAALYAPDGTLYRYPADINTTVPASIPGPTRPFGAQTDTDDWIPTQQQDINGNQITFSSTAGWTDTVARNIPVPAQTSDFTNCTDSRTARAWTWNLPGVNGAPYPIKMCEIEISETIQYSGAPMTYNAYELQSVILPDNTKWVFDYTTDGLGDLQQVTFPLGGTISYTWGNPGELQPTHAYQFTRGVSKRISDPHDGSTPAESDYVFVRNYPNDPTTALTATTTITDGTSANGGLSGYQNDIVHTFTSADSWNESETDWYQGTGASRALMKSTTNDYTTYNLPSAQTISILTNATTTWANQQKTQIGYAYNDPLTYQAASFQCGASCVLIGNPGTASYILQTGKTESDYGNGSPGAILRSTSTSYYAFENSSYLNKNLLNLVSGVAISGSGGNGGTTSYGYDESGSPQGVYGNQTSVSKWLNTVNSNLVSYTYYNSYGMPTQTKDPLGYSSLFSYDASGLYVISSSNPIHQTTLQTYDFNTGQTLSVTDPNSQTTRYTYSDSMGHLTNISYPDQGNTAFIYNDSASGSSVTITKALNQGNTMQTVVEVDGFGRQIESKLMESANQSINSRTQYDYRGRLWKSWNPSRCDPMSVTSCPSESTFGSTTHIYDALDRPTSVINQDGTATQTHYTGNTVNYYDEVSNHWQRTMDGIGRLISVSEPTGSSTGYVYDSQSNLGTVNQLGISSDTPRTRSFVYDSLSRLTSSTNPETGTIGYSYDSSGNLLTKTDARGVMITYSYDTLDRLLSKSYSNDPTGTPSACYQYDSGINGGGSNLIGRLTSSWTQLGSCPAVAPLTGAITRDSILAYDAMGRALIEQKCQWTNCNTGAPYITRTSYNLAGQPVSYGNAVQAIDLTNYYDVAGRLQHLDSSWSDSMHPATIFSVESYIPAGAMQNMTLGTGITVTNTYDSRQRITGSTANQTK